ncbi:hypothetical protein [Kingella oralis]
MPLRFGFQAALLRAGLGCQTVYRAAIALIRCSTGKPTGFPRNGTPPFSGCRSAAAPTAYNCSTAT